MGFIAYGPGKNADRSFINDEAPPVDQNPCRIAAARNVRFATFEQLLCHDETAVEHVISLSRSNNFSRYCGIFYSIDVYHLNHAW
jgi:hypothetical protein